MDTKSDRFSISSKVLTGSTPYSVIPSSSIYGSYAIICKPNAFALRDTALATCPKDINPIVWPQRRGNSDMNGLPSDQRFSLTIWSNTFNRLNDAKSIIIVWSATSSMNVSGTLVTGIPLSVAAPTSTVSAPTLPRDITLQFSNDSIISREIRLPLAMTASASLAAVINSSSLAASISTISASMGSRARRSSRY